MSLFTPTAPHTSENPRGRAEWMVPALIFAAALMLRLWRLPNECPWFDEVITLEHLNAADLSSFLKAVAPRNGAVPPVYLALEYAWAHWISPSETSLRLLSVVFGELTVIITYFLGCRLFGRLAGCVAAIGLAVNSAHVMFSQEIRMYSLAYFLAAVSAYTFLEFMRRGRGDWRLLTAHVLSNLLLGWTHPYGLLIAVPEGLVLAASFRRTFRQKSTWLIAHLLIVWSLADWFFSRDTASTLHRLGWVVKPTFLECPGAPSIEIFLQSCLGGDFSIPNGNGMDLLNLARPFIHALLPVILLAAAGSVTWNEVRRPVSETPRVSAFLWLWLALPPLVLFVISFFWVPSFVYRYVFYCMIPMYLFIGGFAARLARSRRVPLLLLLGFLAAYQSAFLMSQPLRSDWRAAADAINASPKRFDPVIVAKYQCAYALHHYLGGPERRVSSADDVLAMIMQMVRLLRGSHGVWLSVNDLALDPIPASRRIEGALRQIGVTFSKQTFPTACPVSLYYVSARAVQFPRTNPILSPLKRGRANGPEPMRGAAS